MFAVTFTPYMSCWLVKWGGITNREESTTNTIPRVALNTMPEQVNNELVGFGRFTEN